MAGVTHVTSSALYGDTAPQVATVSTSLGRDDAHVCAVVVAALHHQGLIDREMCAIDVVKLRNNSSEQRNGTRTDVEHHPITSRQP